MRCCFYWDPKTQDSRGCDCAKMSGKRQIQLSGHPYLVDGIGGFEIAARDQPLSTLWGGNLESPVRELLDNSWVISSHVHVCFWRAPRSRVAFVFQLLLQNYWLLVGKVAGTRSYLGFQVPLLGLVKREAKRETKGMGPL